MFARVCGNCEFALPDDTGKAACLNIHAPRVLTEALAPACPEYLLSFFPPDPPPAVPSNVVPFKAGRAAPS